MVEVAGLLQAAELLDEAVACAKGLDATLILLDGESEEATRTSSAVALQRFLTRTAVREHVESILYAAALPDSADIAGAVQICITAAVSEAESLLRQLEHHQFAIMDVTTAWETTLQIELGNVQAREKMNENCLARGLFPNLARSLAGDLSLEGCRADDECRDFVNAWIDRIYRVNALRVLVEGTADKSRSADAEARLKERAKVELQLIRQLRQESLTSGDASLQRWKVAWNQLVTGELVEDLLDLLCLAFPAKRHRDAREQVVREVLVDFQNDGLYRYEELAAGELGLLNYLAKVACRAMRKRIRQAEVGAQEQPIAELIVSEPPCGREVELDRDRGIAAWLMGFSLLFRYMLWRTDRQEGIETAAVVVGRPASVLRHVWDELRRSARRINFHQTSSH